MYILENYGGQFQLSGFLKGLLGQFSTAEGIQAARDFFHQNPIENSKMAISQGLEASQLKVVWFNRDLNDMKNYLTQTQ